MNEPTKEEGNFICLDCFESFSETGVSDESFDDQFGSVASFCPCCPYCGGNNYAEGKIWMNKTTVHTSTKNYRDKRGRIHIARGDQYEAQFVKGYFLREDGTREGIYIYRKAKL